MVCAYIYPTMICTAADHRWTRWPGRQRYIKSQTVRRMPHPSFFCQGIRGQWSNPNVFEASFSSSSLLSQTHTTGPRHSMTSWRDFSTKATQNWGTMISRSSSSTVRLDLVGRARLLNGFVSCVVPPLLSYVSNLTDLILGIS